MENKTIQDECYECGSRDIERENGELNCRGCGSIFTDK